MRLLLQRPSPRACIVCSRPAPSHALTCAYCGEDLPHRRHQLLIYAAITSMALAATLAFAVGRSCSTSMIPTKLSLPASMLVALGIGLALLPPKLRGVAGATRRERLGQMAPRYFGALALTLLVAMATLAAGTSKPWSMTDTVLAMATMITLFTSPLTLGLPWLPLAAGLLAAAGFLLS